MVLPEQVRAVRGVWQKASREADWPYRVARKSRSISRGDRPVGDGFAECERVVQHGRQDSAENSEANCGGVGLLLPMLRMGAWVEVVNSSTPGDEEETNKN